MKAPRRRRSSAAFVSNYASRGDPSHTVYRALTTLLQSWEGINGTRIEWRVSDSTHSIIYTSQRLHDRKQTFESFTFVLNCLFISFTISGKLGCPFLDTNWQTSYSVTLVDLKSPLPARRTGLSRCVMPILWLTLNRPR